MYIYIYITDKSYVTDKNVAKSICVTKFICHAFIKQKFIS